MNLSRIQADLVQSIMMDNSSECGSWHPGEQQVVDTCAFWLEGILGHQLFKFASSFFLKNLSPIKSNFKGRFQCISLLVAPREINQPPAGIFFVIRKG